jgi:DNA-binding transcriptional MerR regulator
MHYTIKQLAELAGVTTRTLRWYDKLGLLRASRQDNGYRIYDPNAVDRLQHILFYRELGLPLEDISSLLHSKDYSPTSALREHLAALRERRGHLDQLINTVERTIDATEKGEPMSDTEKFAAFKQKSLRDNEEKYGAEIRERYGEDVVKASNAKFAGLTQRQWEESEALRMRLETTLAEALKQGDPASETARQAARLHKEWLGFFLPNYSPELHKGLAQMYVDDPRFKANYEKIAPGATEFLRDAIWAWLG